MTDQTLPDSLEICGVEFKRFGSLRATIGRFEFELGLTAEVFMPSSRYWTRVRIEGSYENRGGGQHRTLDEAVAYLSNSIVMALSRQGEADENLERATRWIAARARGHIVEVTRG
jgi:hypothetical protein